ncbi:MAG: ExbD/TolR family protein [Dialister pneumosintes]
MRGKRNFHILKQPSVIIIPMIDIMLFLLVFFMISTIYMVQVNTMQITLPSVVNAKTETKSNIISVTIDKDGHVFYDMEKQPTIEIIGAVKKTIAENPDSIFIIRADRNVNYFYVTDTIDSIKSAGGVHISLAAESRRQ